MTVGVVDAPAQAGRGRYHGVCSWYLAHENAGAEISAFVKAPCAPFQLPDDPTTPLILAPREQG